MPVGLKERGANNTPEWIKRHPAVDAYEEGQLLPVVELTDSRENAFRAVIGPILTDRNDEPVCFVYFFEGHRCIKGIRASWETIAQIAHGATVDLQDLQPQKLKLLGFTPDDTPNGIWPRYEQLREAFLRENRFNAAAGSNRLF